MSIRMTSLLAQLFILPGFYICINLTYEKKIWLVFFYIGAHLNITHTHTKNKSRRLLLILIIAAYGNDLIAFWNWFLED